MLALVEGARSKGELVGLVGGSRAAVYRHVQVLTRLGLVECRVVGIGRGVHHVVELTAEGRVLLAGLGLAGRRGGGAGGAGSVGSGVGVDVAVSLGRSEVADLLGDAWRFARWRFLRGRLDEDEYWRRLEQLKKIAGRAGVDLSFLSGRRGDGRRGRLR